MKKPAKKAPAKKAKAKRSPKKDFAQRALASVEKLIGGKLSDGMRKGK